MSHRVIFTGAFAMCLGLMSGARADDGLADVPYDELVERGLEQRREGGDRGALYYLEAAASRPEAETDPRVFVALAFIARKQCRLDVAWRQARRADRMARAANARIAPLAARLHTEVERSSGLVEVELRLGGPVEITPPVVETPAAAAPASDGSRTTTPATDPVRARVVLRADQSFSTPLVARSPGEIPAPAACVEQARSDLSAGIERLRAGDDAQPRLVQLRLPLGRWHVAGGAIDVVPGSTARRVALEVNEQATGMSALGWGLVAGATVGAGVGAYFFFAQDTGPRGASDFDAALVDGGAK